MAYRNGTYIAFDGLGFFDPTKSDFKYYATIKAWAKNKNIEFHFTNSHEKTYAVRDTSTEETLKKRIRERLSNSKNMVVIISKDTRRTGSMLSYEIEQAIDRYKIPLIISYVNYESIMKPKVLSSLWPLSLQKRIINKMTRAIHIPFRKEALLDSIEQFNINTPPKTSLSHYSYETYRNWGYL